MSDGIIPERDKRPNRVIDAAEKQRNRQAERHRRLAAALKSNLRRRRGAKIETAG